jgi:hypothetical protein
MKRRWKMTFTIVGLLMVLAAANFTPMISLKTPGMEEHQMSGITTYSVPEDQQAAGAIAERIGMSQERVLQAMGDIDAEGIRVIVYPNQNALKRKTLGVVGMLVLPNWFIGRNTTNAVLITSPESPGPQHTYETVVQAAVHEYVHVLTYRLNRQLDYWLLEGLAVYLAEQVPSGDVVRESARNLSFDEFDETNAIKFANVGGYALAYNLVAYLEQTYGWDQVMALAAPGATYESVLGVTKREVFDAWRSGILEG